MDHNKEHHREEGEEYHREEAEAESLSEEDFLAVEDQQGEQGVVVFQFHNLNNLLDLLQGFFMIILLRPVMSCPSRKVISLPSFRRIPMIGGKVKCVASEDWFLLTTSKRCKQPL